ncbi:hypothetical protein HKX48_005525 [Thoreauomyces humboldtii]|nr:hypothetical protein HKX48_005525 [Thoreauomyces humboldtii]
MSPTPSIHQTITAVRTSQNEHNHKSKTSVCDRLPLDPQKTDMRKGATTPTISREGSTASVVGKTSPTLSDQFRSEFEHAGRRVENECANASRYNSRKANGYKKKKSPKSKSPSSDKSTSPIQLHSASPTSGQFGKFIPASADNSHFDRLGKLTVDLFGSGSGLGSGLGTTQPPLRQQTPVNVPIPPAASSPGSSSPTRSDGKKRRKARSRKKKAAANATDPSKASPAKSSLEAPMPSQVVVPLHAPDATSNAVEAASAAEPAIETGRPRNKSVGSCPSTNLNIAMSQKVTGKLYPSLIEQVVAMGYAVDNIDRRSEYLSAGTPRSQFKNAKSPPEWKEDPACVRRSLCNLTLRPRSDSATPLSQFAGLLEKFLLGSVQLPGLTAMERESLSKNPATELFTVTRDTRSRGMISDSLLQHRQLPPFDKAELRIQRAIPVRFPVDGFPQTVVLVARECFSIPILKMIMSRPNYEMLGLKVYVCAFDRNYARYLSPYEVGEDQYEKSLTEICKPVGEGRNWHFVAMRNMNAQAEVEAIVEKYLASFLGVSQVPKGSDLGRRRRGVHQQDSTPESVETLEDLKLQVLVSRNTTAAYSQLCLLFKDKELVPGDTSEWQDRAAQAPWYLADPYISRTLLDHPTYVNTITIVKQSQELGKLLKLAATNKFHVVSAKVMQVHASAAKRMFSFADTGRIGSDVVNTFTKELTEAPVHVLVLCNFNGIALWNRLLDAYLLEKGAKPSPGSLFRGGLYTSSTFNEAKSHRLALLPEGPAVKVHISKLSAELDLILEPSPITTDPIKRKVICNKRSGRFHEFHDTTRDDVPEVVCVTMLPVKKSIYETFESWGVVLDALLKEKPPKEECVVPVIPRPSSPVKSTEQPQVHGTGKVARRRRKHQLKKLQRANSPETSTSPVPYEEPQVEDIGPVPRMVACRYVVPTKSAIEEWIKWYPDPQAATVPISTWGERNQRALAEATRAGTFVASLPSPSVFESSPPWELIQIGACMGVALEVDSADRVKRIIGGLPAEIQRCVSFTTTCEEACGQLPIFFGELFDSLYQVVPERKASVCSSTS